MSAEVHIDIDHAARKVLRDPRGLSGVGIAELVALAEYVCVDAPRFHASMAAAIALVVRAQNRLHASASPAGQQTSDDSEIVSAINNLNTLFQQELPNETLN